MRSATGQPPQGAYEFVLHVKSQKQFDELLWSRWAEYGFEGDTYVRGLRHVEWVLDHEIRSLEAE